MKKILPKKYSKIIRYGLSSFLVVFVSFKIFLYQKSPYDVSRDHLQSSRHIAQVVEQLHRYWRAELEIKLDCTAYGLTDSSPDYAWECNPRVLECMGAHDEKIYYGRGKARASFGFKAIADKYFEVLSRAQGDGATEYGFLFHLVLQTEGEREQILPVILEDSCRDRYLPQRSYLTGARGDLMALAWDNMSRHYYLDMYPVTNHDIYLWALKAGNFKRREQFSDRKQWYRPALGLTYQEQKDYCLFVGKKLMRSHLWDAGAFAPLSQSFFHPNDKGVWPWGREKTQLRALSVYKRNTKNFCYQLTAAECLDKGHVWYPHADSSTWMGLRDVVGGVMESMNVVWDDNPWVKVSSFLFSYNSPYQKAGLKAAWSGQGDGTREIQSKLSDGQTINFNHFSQELPIGFRCFRQRDLP